MSESRNGTPLEGVRVVEMGGLLAGPVYKVQYNDAVYEGGLGLGEEEWDGLCGRGII